MISRQFRFFLLLTFLFTTALVVVLQYNANKNIDALVQGNENLLKEFQMRARLQDLQNDLLSIDNNVRNNIIRNDETRRTSIDAKVAGVKASVKELGDLLVTDSSRKLWNQLNALTAEKIRFSYKVLDTLSGSGKKAAEDFLNEQKGAQLSEAIEMVSTQLDNVRQQYLTQIIKQTDANSLKAKRLGLIMGMIAVIVVMFTFWYIINRIRKQQEMITQLNESERKVREAAIVKEHFISNMSHEIRTPMNAILGYTNLLQKQPLADIPKQYVQNIKGSSENLLHIINDVLDLSKIESGMMRIEKQVIDIRKLVYAVYDLFASKADEKKLDFTIHISDEIPASIMGDWVRITQIITNLVSNAIKFTESGFVSVTLTADNITNHDLHMQITVADSGIGIAKTQQEQVFERFIQAEESTTRRYGGTGLGLSIVQQIVTLLHGKITLKSQPGAGASFTVELPFDISPAQPNIEAPVFINPLQLAGNENIQILVVEDNPMNQNLMEHLLTEWRMRFDIAANGKKALQALMQKQYDLVLMDIQMPEMDGYTATRFIRNQLKLDLPIIAMTAHAFAGEREKCISYGMTDYLPKPVREQDLYRMIHTFITPFRSLNNSTEPAEKRLADQKFNTIDLSYLHKLSGGDMQFEKEMATQFIKQVPGELKMLKESFRQKDWITLQQTAHNLKTTVSFLGLSSLLQKDLEILEKNTGSSNMENEFGHNLSNVIIVCNKALSEAAMLTGASIKVS